MSIAQRIVTWAALVVLAGVVLYQAIENHRLRNELQVLQQQQALSEERNTALETDYNLATNQLVAALSAAQGQTTELLRLRGEVSRLKKVVQEQPKERAQPQTSSAAKEGVQTEAGLGEEQRKFLAEMTENIKTKNSVADINRLKDSLARWEELFANNTNMFPGNMQAVIPIVKQRVIERVAELEREAAKDDSGPTR